LASTVKNSPEKIDNFGLQPNQRTKQAFAEIDPTKPLEEGTSHMTFTDQGES